MPKKSKYIVFVLMLVLVLAACGNGGSNQKVKTYDHDGYMGLTESFPNLPTNYHSYHTYAVEKDMILDAARRVKGVKGGAVAFGNAVAYVQLDLEEGITPAEAEHIKVLAFKEITYNMPRYPVVVSVNSR
jgi:hypothetical protein